VADICGTDLIMKPLKKTLQSSPGPPSTAASYEFFQNILKKVKPKGGKLLSKKDQSEVFFILTADLPPEELSKLLQSKKGVTINLQDNLLKRLLKLEKDYHHLKTLSLTDSLTGLYNQRFFNKQLKIEITRTKRTGQPFCLMFIDLDNFKSVNDTLGHTKGDEFLVNLCRRICQKIRPTDFACRYGGDEFIIIMPATYLVDGVSIAQRWHDLIKQVAFQMELDVSSSIGIDEFDVSCTLKAEEFLDKVDKELYKAKNTGKNKVSYPGESLQGHKAEEKFVTPAEKDALYKGSATIKQKRKQLSKKG
jgi:diguanylate cyclase (GGDEF)-like protein